MFDWMRRSPATEGLPLTIVPRSGEGMGDGNVEYRRLRKYLQDRYASRVVLTFSEIEDLLGFALPDRARVQQAWWDTAAQPTAQSGAWTGAGRSAAANLVAKSVVFERDPALALPGSR